MILIIPKARTPEKAPDREADEKNPDMLFVSNHRCGYVCNRYRIVKIRTYRVVILWRG